MAKLTLFIDPPLHAGQSHQVVVQVAGAPAGTTATVVLSQTQGKMPLMAPLSKSATINPTGEAYLPFDVRLEGPTSSATLLVTASDTAGTPYSPDATSFEVEP
jgi:hypothetical protein